MHKKHKFIFELFELFVAMLFVAVRYGANCFHGHASLGRSDSAAMLE
jgi:hypothetical protein